MRLIDADEVMQAVNELMIVDKTVMSFVLMNAPPVDAVPVVRCESCIFWDKAHVSCEGLAKCLTGEGGIRYRNRSDFCSRGEREDGDNAEGSV